MLHQLRDKARYWSKIVCTRRPRLLGMITYLARYLPQYSEVTAPLRQLLSQDIEFRWDDSVHGAVYRKLQTMLSTAPVLQLYDVTKDVVVQCDASQHGLWQLPDSTEPALGVCFSCTNSNGARLRANRERTFECALCLRTFSYLPVWTPFYSRN